MELSASPRQRSIKDLYFGTYVRKVALLAFLVLFLLLASVFAASTGSANIGYADVFISIGGAICDVLHVGGFPEPASDIAPIIVVDLRLPRILLAVITGINLAVAGAVMQGVLRNPLVSPFTLGLASAASFGAAITIVLGAGVLSFMIADNNYLIVFNAFVFGCLSMLLIYAVSKMKGSSQSTLILAGVVIGYIFQAGVLVLKYLSNNDKLKELVIWLMGGMWGANWEAVYILVPITVFCVTLLSLKAWDLNALAAGDDIARNLGVNVDRLRLYGLLLCTLAASSCLAFTGVIGFIGLMAPHICRMLIGNDHRYLIPCSALMGAIILLVSDTFARTIISPIEIPVGIIMYVVGGIFFLYLLFRGKESHLY